jgi:tetratricopeptide (TPR) repeat protein
MNKFSRILTFLLGISVLGYGILGFAGLLWGTTAYGRSGISIFLLIIGCIGVGCLLVVAAWKQYQGGVPFFVGLFLLSVGLVFMALLLSGQVMATSFCVVTIIITLAFFIAGFALLWHGHKLHYERYSNRRPLPSMVDSESSFSEMIENANSLPLSQQYRYWAFISYSNKDKKWATWLHRAIETYGIPAQLVKHPTPIGEPAPKRFCPLFHDRAELPAASDLGAEIKDALRASRYLIVVCSRYAAQSHWVNKEIETFKRFGRRDRVLAMIIDGEPNTGDDRECFPVALRKVEPIAADVRLEGDGKANAKLKLLAGMLGVSFDAIKQREAHRQIRRLQLILSAAMLTLLVFAGMVWYSYHQRNKAIKARQQAESILQYLLYDLRDKLAPVGRLDIVADVQKRVDAYYQKLGIEPDNPEILQNRSVAYSNEGNRLQAQGNLPGALKAYRKAYAIIQRLAQADPKNVQWQLDLSASHNNIGNILEAQGDLTGALKAYRESLGIDKRFVQVDPANTIWQHSLSVSYSRVGSVLRSHGDLTGALEVCRNAHAIVRRLAQADPTNTEWQRDLNISLINEGEILRTQGDLAGALKTYQESMTIAQRLAQIDPMNAEWQYNLAISHERIGIILYAQGKLNEALTAFRSKQEIISSLVVHDLTNAGWQHDMSNDDVGKVLLTQGNLTGALKVCRDTHAIMQRLAQADPTNARWQSDLSTSYNNLAYILRDQGDLFGALKAYQESLDIRRRLVQADPTNNEWKWDFSISLINEGRILLARGDLAGALKAYRESLSITQWFAQTDPNNIGHQGNLLIST